MGFRPLIRKDGVTQSADENTPLDGIVTRLNGESGDLNFVLDDGLKVRWAFNRSINAEPVSDRSVSISSGISQLESSSSHTNCYSELKIVSGLTDKTRVGLTSFFSNGVNPNFGETVDKLIGEWNNAPYTSIGIAITGIVKLNGVQICDLGTTITNGDTIRFCINYSNRLWIAVNGGAWNNDPTADPSTDVGYLAIPGDLLYLTVNRASGLGSPITVEANSSLEHCLYAKPDGSSYIPISGLLSGLTDVRTTSPYTGDVLMRVRTNGLSSIWTNRALNILETYEVVTAVPVAQLQSPVVIGEQIPGQYEGIVWKQGDLVCSLALNVDDSIAVVNADGTKSIVALNRTSSSGSAHYSRLIIEKYGRIYLSVCNGADAVSVYQVGSNSSKFINHSEQSQSVSGAIGDLATLTTTNKQSLVEAINEVANNALLWKPSIVCDLTIDSFSDLASISTAGSVVTTTVGTNLTVANGTLAVVTDPLSSVFGIGYTFNAALGTWETLTQNLAMGECASIFNRTGAYVGSAQRSCSNAAVAYRDNLDNKGFRTDPSPSKVHASRVYTADVDLMTLYTDARETASP